MKNKRIKKGSTTISKSKDEIAHKLNHEGVTLADLFANSKYGTYGNAKATIVVGYPMQKGIDYENKPQKDK